jgi:hypothetical protein
LVSVKVIFPNASSFIAPQKLPLYSSEAKLY